MREGSDVGVQEAHLVLTVAQPREVAARVHQAHHKQVNLATLAVELDKGLEEGDLGDRTGPVDERDETLGPLTLPLVDDRAHRRLSDLVALPAQFA